MEFNAALETRKQKDALSAEAKGGHQQTNLEGTAIPTGFIVKSPPPLFLKVKSNVAIPLNTFSDYFPCSCLYSTTSIDNRGT